MTTMEQALAGLVPSRHRQATPTRFRATTMVD